MTSPYELLVGLALLRERKRHLEQAEHHTLEAWSALMVRLSGLSCLINRDEVDEIISLESITPVRGVAKWVSGLSYFRGQLLNIIDLKKLFALPDDSYSPNARVLVVRGQREWFGLRVDELVGIRHVWQDTQRVEYDAQAKKSLGVYASQCFLMDDKTLVVLDIKRLITDLNDSSSAIHTAWQKERE